MAVISDDEVQSIIERVRQRLDGTDVPKRGKTETAKASFQGVFNSVDEAVEVAWRAFRSSRTIGLERRKVVVEAIRESMRRHTGELSRMAHEETSLGRREDKILKNTLVIEKTPGPEDLEPQTWTGDHGLTVTEYAPYGVVGAITPTTNPTATIINNTIAVISAGNSIVFNVHPNAKHVSAYTIHLINEAIVSAGGPSGLVTASAEPTITSAQQLMNHPKVRILVVTGGPGVVKEAQKTGKRCILAGPGNPPVVVDETADIDLAGREIVRGASFDNNIICIDEKVVFAVDKIYDQLLRSLASHGAYLLQEHQLRRLERVIFKEMGAPFESAKLNAKWIGKNAGTILSEVTRHSDAENRDIRLLVADVPIEHCLVWTEQMMPVMPVVRVKNVDAAIEAAIRAEKGNGHTASIFSSDVGSITRMAREIDVSIFVANSANLAGLGDGGEGFTSFSIASPTGEGLTRPRSFSRLRRMTIAGGLRIV